MISYTKTISTRRIINNYKSMNLRLISMLKFYKIMIKKSKMRKLLLNLIININRNYY